VVKLQPFQIDDGYSEFTDLLDTPSSYAGQSGKAIIVKAGEDGLEFGVASGGSGLVNGYLPMPERDVDPPTLDNYGSIYTKEDDAYGTTELFFIDSYGQVTQITQDGYLATYNSLRGVRLLEGEDLPNQPGSFTLFAKTVSGNTELFARDSSGNDIQITSNGQISGGGGGSLTLQQAYLNGADLYLVDGPIIVDAYGYEALNIDGYIGLVDGYDPEPIPGKGLLYVKSVDGYNQLFFMDDYGQAYQMSDMGSGLVGTVDDALKGATGIPTGSFPSPPVVFTSITTKAGEDILVSFSGSVKPTTVPPNPYENIYIHLTVGSTTVYTYYTTILAAVLGGGLEATNVSFSYVVTNLSAGTHNIDITIDTGTGPGDPAGTAEINNPVLGAVQVRGTGDNIIADGYLALGEIPDPTPSPDIGIMYTKDIDGYTEFHYMDSYGSAIQITDKGSIIGGGGNDPDAIHDNVAGEIAAIAAKAVPVAADLLLIEDSADSNNKKKVQVGNLPGGAGGGTLQQAYNSGNTIVIVPGTPFHVDAYDAYEAMNLDGYLGLHYLIEDPQPQFNKGEIYVLDAYDGYNPAALELFYMNHAGQSVQITNNGKLNIGATAYEDELDPASTDGTETFIQLSQVPMIAPSRRSLRDLDVYRNGVLMRYVSSLGVSKIEWTYNTSLNRAEFVASGSSGDWYIAIYRS